MCGICGAVGIALGQDRLRAATDLMRHRGPDGDGYYCRPGIGLGMRRLSIIDLAGGNQPKSNEFDTIQVVFNGEIYNFRDLRSELVALGHVIDSESDTEVIAHAYESWGLECFTRLNGIFAIAIWDARSRQLVLARDHLGVKPLFYSTVADGLAFGSELKPLVALLPQVPAIDAAAVAMYLRYKYVPAPLSIFAGIRKLMPGHYLIASEGGGDPVIRPYWDPEAVAARKRTGLSPADAEDLVDTALRQAVRRQLISDVPLGAFLSGGVDSSAVVAMMRQVSNGPVKTFSIGMEDREFDEAEYAEEVARYLGTEHHSWTINEADALAAVPKLPHYFDEPFGDPSAIPTYLVSQLAREHVTVSLSGDGGDELFGGYDRYQRLRSSRPWWSVPVVVRRGALSLAVRSPGPLGSFARRVRPMLAAPTVSEAYRNMMSAVFDPDLAALIDIGEAAYQPNPQWPGEVFTRHSLDEAMMLTDLVTYLPDDILTKVDRASMAHSLEARVPLLDLYFVELALSLPTDVRLSHGPKTLLKNVLKRYVPATLVDRPKHGFGIPIRHWFRGQLRSYLTDHLTVESLQAHGLLQVDGVHQLLGEHLSGTVNRASALWVILMFQMWYEDFGRTFSAGRGGAPDAPILVS